MRGGDQLEPGHLGVLGGETLATSSGFCKALSAKLAGILADYRFYLPSLQVSKLE